MLTPGEPRAQTSRQRACRRGSRWFCFCLTPYARAGPIVLLNRVMPAYISSRMKDSVVLRGVFGERLPRPPCLAHYYLSLLWGSVLSSSASATSRSPTPSLTHGPASRTPPSVLIGKAVSPLRPSHKRAYSPAAFQPSRLRGNGKLAWHYRCPPHPPAHLSLQYPIQPLLSPQLYPLLLFVREFRLKCLFDFTRRR